MSKFFILDTAEFRGQEGALDDWSGSLRVALDATYAELRQNPFIGEVIDPLRGLFAHSVNLYAGHLPLVLIYRVSSEARIIEMLEMRVDK